MEPKKQVIWTTCCKVMVKITKSGLYLVSANLDYIGFSKGKSKMKRVWWTIYIGHCLVRTINVCKCRNTPKIYLFISEKMCFSGLRFLGSFWQTIPWKPCVSAPKWCMKQQTAVFRNEQIEKALGYQWLSKYHTFSLICIWRLELLQHCWTI